MAAVLPHVSRIAPQMTQWRQQIHAWPELRFEEVRTAALVAEVLESLGLEVHRGIGGTGVVAIVQGKADGPSIGLRADMDALPMDEDNEVGYKSTRKGVAHCCGHDGHTAALLGTARYLAENPPATGRVVLIFQPAEEGGGGALKMMEDGLITRFHCDEAYAFHNMPLLGKGVAGVHTGPALSSIDVFEVQITGVGGHGAAPHIVTDPLQVLARLAVEISGIVGRHVDPMETGVITVGRMNAGTSHNIIPDTASLSGTIRTLSNATRNLIVARLQSLCDGLALISGCKIECTLQPGGCPPCINAPEQAACAAAACADILGEENVRTDLRPYPYADDFASVLEQWPGAYFFLGQDGAMVHKSAYNFDDALLPVAASVFARIVQRRLG